MGAEQSKKEEKEGDAGPGSNHYLITAPRHLSALAPGREDDPKVKIRLSRHLDVASWAEQKERAVAEYEQGLREESRRLAEKEMRDSINAAHKLREKNMAEARKALDDRVSVIKQRVTEQVKKVTTSLMSVSSEVQGAAGNVTNSIKTVVPFRKMRALEEASQGAMTAPVIDFGDLREEDQGDDDSPPGICDKCGKHEYLCAHCDFIRCPKCELRRWQVRSLGAIVCDRCYVYYAVEGKQWKPPGNIAAAASKAFEDAGDMMQGHEHKKQASKVKPVGLCDSCPGGVEEFACARCDTIYCPNCQQDCKEALAIGALLCERCFILWQSEKMVDKAGGAVLGKAPKFPGPPQKIGDAGGKKVVPIRSSSKA